MILQLFKFTIILFLVFLSITAVVIVSNYLVYDTCQNCHHYRKFYGGTYKSWVKADNILCEKPGNVREALDCLHELYALEPDITRIETKNFEASKYQILNTVITTEKLDGFVYNPRNVCQTAYAVSLNGQIFLKDACRE